MAIIGPFPAVIAAGQPVSAAPVMADFNWIASQVNTNAQPIGALQSRVMVSCVGATFLTSTVPFVVGMTTSGQIATVLSDALAEFNTVTGHFTAKNAGYYQITVNGIGFPNAGTITAEPQIICRKNGSVIGQPSFFCFVEGHLTFDGLVGSNFAVTHCNANDVLTATVMFTFTGGPAFFQNANLTIIGLG